MFAYLLVQRSKSQNNIKKKKSSLKTQDSLYIIWKYLLKDRTRPRLHLQNYSKSSVKLDHDVWVQTRHTQEGMQNFSLYRKNTSSTSKGKKVTAGICTKKCYFSDTMDRSASVSENTVLFSETELKISQLSIWCIEWIL